MARVGVKVGQQQKCQFLALSTLFWLIIATLTLTVVGQRFPVKAMDKVASVALFPAVPERILNRRVANIREV